MTDTCSAELAIDYDSLTCKLDAGHSGMHQGHGDGGPYAWATAPLERAKRPDREQIARAIKESDASLPAEAPVSGLVEVEPSEAADAVMSLFALEPEAREEMCHFAPYGSTNAACDETVPRGALKPETTGQSLYSDPRFTDKRSETTCPECRFRCGITDSEAREVTDAEVEAAARAIAELEPGEAWPEGFAVRRFRERYRRDARAALEAAREVSRG